MEKRAFLLAEETLKIILSLIVLGFLVFLLVSVYFSTRDKDLEFAEASLERILSTINLGSNEITIYNPEGWELINQGEEICICKDHDAVSFRCDDENKACRLSEFRVEGDMIRIKPPLILKINHDTKIISKT